MSRSPSQTGDRVGARALFRQTFSTSTCDLPSLCSPHAPLDSFARSALPQDHSMPEMKLQDLKAKTPVELVAFAEELEVENAPTMRKQELMFAILKQLAIARDRHHRRRRRRGAAGRIRLPALAGSELPARPRRHLRLALADPPLRLAHRRHHRRPDPLARRKASATSRSSRSTRSISRTRRRRVTRSISTTSRRSIPTSG